MVSEKHNSGFSTNDKTTVSDTVIKLPEKLPDLSSGCDCSVGTAEVVRSFENRSSCSGSCATGHVKEDHKVVIDVNKCGDGEICGDGEKVCRICHLNNEQPLKLGSPKAKTVLVKLGCGCRGELSFAHLHCAEAWFKLKGNRICEICGQTVINVRGVGNESFLEEWKDSRSNDDEPSSSETSEGARCWQGQPLCNFIMACLVIAFVLPWFFRINFWM